MKRPIHILTDRLEPSSPSPSPTPSKRRHFRPPDALFRLLLPSPAAETFLPFAQIADETNSRIRLEDAPPNAEELVLTIIGDARNQPVGNEEMSLAQLATVRVLERILAVEDGVTCRMLVPGNHVGCVLGKGGKIIERIRTESGAVVRVFGKEMLPPCAAPGDELVYMNGSLASVKKALLSVTSCLQDNPRTEMNNFPKPFGFIGSGSSHSPLPQMEPYAQRNYLPGMHVPEYHPKGHLMNPGTEISPASHRKYQEEEVVYRMLCPHEKVGSLIGKGGGVVRGLQNETGALIRVADPVPDSDERVITISARETSEVQHSPAQNAVIRVHSKLVEIGDEKSSIIARFLVPSQQIGCLLGKGGAIIAEMRKVTGANIRIIVGESVPKCAQPNDEIVQVVGTVQSVQDALIHITGRIRDTILPFKPFPSVGMTHYTSAQSEMRPPAFRSGHEAITPGHYPPISSQHGPDPAIGFSGTLERHPLLYHNMDHIRTDRAPFSYGSEPMGPHPVLDHPSPTPWVPEVIRGGNGRSLHNIGTSAEYETGVIGNAPTVTSRTVEVVVPQQYLGYVCGGNLADIRKISGASVTVHNPKPGKAEGLVLISGFLDQIKFAQSLLHAFILCGLDTNCNI